MTAVRHLGFVGGTHWIPTNAHSLVGIPEKNRHDRLCIVHVVSI